MKPHLQLPGEGISHFSISRDSEEIAMIYTSLSNPASVEAWDFCGRRMLRKVDVGHPDWLGLSEVQLSQSGEN